MNFGCDTVERLSDLLGMLPTGLVVIGQDANPRAPYALGIGVPPLARTAWAGRSDEPTPCELIGVLFALDD